MDEQEITIKDLETGDKEYLVCFWIEEGGRVRVKANSKEEAIEKVDEYLNMYSLDEELYKKFDCTNREWDVMESETEEVI